MRENMRIEQSEINNVFFHNVKGGVSLVQTLLKMFYLEGRSFAQTEESLRWQLYLRDLQPYKAASILWTVSNMDSFVLEAREPRMNVDQFLSF